MFLLPEAQKGEAWEPSKKPGFVRNQGAMNRKGLSLFHPSDFKGLNPAGQKCNALLLIAHLDFYQSLYRGKDS
jgi:hypothetical protein